MKKFLLMAAAALISVNAMAIDKVQKKTTTKEITSVEELASATFQLTNADGQVMCTPDGWDIKVIASAQFTGNDQGGFYKLEAYDGHWLIPVYQNADGTTRRTFWAGNQYVNSQPAGGNVIFGLAGTNDQHGQDGKNLAVWDIIYTEGQGFAFHCFGRDIYIGYDASAARPVENIVYWTATGKVNQYDAAEVANAYNEVNGLNMQASVKTALEAAKSAYDAAPSFGKLTTYGDAVNAAIDSSEKYGVSVGGDLTSILVNPHFNTKDLSAWNMNGKASPTVTPDPTHNCEFYEKDFDMSMTIHGMKKGTYEIGMQAFQRPAGANAGAAQAYENGTNTSIAQLYTTAMETEVPDIMAEKSETSIFGDGSGGWPNDSKFEYNGTTYYVPNSVDGAKAWFELGHYQTTAKAVVTEDGGDLTFGFKGKKVGGGWILFDNFTLKYISEDVLVDASESEKLIANAPTAKMNADVKAAMDAAIAALEADKTNGTLYNALKDAISDANTSVEKYAAAKAALDAQKALMDATNVYDAAGFAAYEAAWTANSTKYENGTLTNEDGVVNPTAATGWHASTEYNFLLTPWTIGGQAANKFDKALYMNTWSTEGNGDGTHFSTPFFEYWTGDDNSLADNTISTTINGLENGIYEVSIWVRARAKNGVDADNATGITLSANGASIDVTEGSKVGQFNIKEYTVEGIVSDGTLTITLDVKGANISWLSFKNVKYAKTGEAASATMAVKAEAGYGTFVAPFEVAVPAGVKAYTVDGVENDVLTLTEVGNAIAANTPVVLEGTLDATTVYGKADVKSATAGLLTGVYEDTQAPVGSYVLQNQDGVVGFYLVGETVPTVKANHAYLEVAYAIPDVKAFYFDEATAIQAVNALTAGKAQIFDMNGRQINKLQKGINIVNGVKVLVK